MVAKNNANPVFHPSAADRMLACPGSYALEENIPNVQTSFNKAAASKNKVSYAEEGKAAHKLAEWALTDGKYDAGVYVGQTVRVTQGFGKNAQYKDVTIDQKMCDNVQTYVEAIRARLQKYQAMKNVKSATLHVEKRLDASSVFGIAGQGGIADAVIVVEYKNGGGMIWVEDLKYGAGVKVDAAQNTQLMIYAAAALREYSHLSIKKLGLAIHMPRLGGASTCEVTAKSVESFVQKLQAGTSLALQQREVFKESGAKALTLKPGNKQCRFCRAKSICPAFNKAAANGNEAQKPVQIKIPKNLGKPRGKNK